MKTQQMSLGLPDIRMIAVGQMYIDPDYQRPPIESKIEHIVTHYKPELMTPITVSETELGYAVMDGQHRLLAAKRLGMMLLQCIVTSMSKAQQALYFREANEARTPVSLLQRHRAMVCAGDPLAVAVQRAVEAVGASVTDGGQMAFRCMKALYRAIQTEERLGRPGLVVRALDTLVRAWPTSETARKADFVVGVMLFYATYWDDVRDADVIDKLMLVDPRKVAADIDLKKVSDRSGLANPAAKVFCEMFNAKRRNRLDVVRLERMTGVLKGR